MAYRTDYDSQDQASGYDNPGYVYELDLSPPPGIEMSLWRSLVTGVLERIAPEKLPPLELTSEPVEVGILLADLMQLPWYRTVFSNLGDALGTDTLPPLQLESKPVDVGELLGDSLEHGWWYSLATTLREKLSPEKMPALRLTSKPVPAFGAETGLIITDWSSLLDNPKVFLPDAPKPAVTARPSSATQAQPQPVAPPKPVAEPSLFAMQMQFKRDLSRTRFRQKIWISLAAAEVVFLVVTAVRGGSVF